MKNLKDIIQERLHITKDTSSNYSEHDDPIIGELSYDYYGEPWEIIDFCDINDKQKLNKLIRKYDNNGVFKDFFNEYDPNDYEPIKYAVAAEAIDTTEYTIFVWGYDGLCFENKPKK